VCSHLLWVTFTVNFGREKGCRQLTQAERHYCETCKVLITVMQQILLLAMDVD
jgi:hypothetical protein